MAEDAPVDMAYRTQRPRIGWNFLGDELAVILVRHKTDLIAVRFIGRAQIVPPGNLADFVFLDLSPLDAEPEEITDIRVLATVAGGQPVFQAGDSPLRL